MKMIKISFAETMARDVKQKYFFAASFNKEDIYWIESEVKRLLQCERASIQSFAIMGEFEAYEAMEETIVRYTERICRQHHSFSFQAEDLYFHLPHLFQIRFRKSELHTRFSNGLAPVDEYIRSCSCSAIKIVNNPCLTIDVGWKENLQPGASPTASIPAKDLFIPVKEIILLKWDNLQKIEKVVNRYTLQPLPVRYSL